MNDQNRRLLLTVVLCMAVYSVWAYLFGPKPKPPGAPATTAQGVTQPETTPTSTSPGQAGVVPAPATPAATDVPRETSALPRPPTRKLTLSSEKLKLVVSTDGGELESIQLLGPKFRKASVKGSEPTQLELIGLVARPLPLATQLTAADGKVLIPAGAGYEVVAESPTSVTLKARAPGVELTRKLELDPQSYRLSVSMEVKSEAALDARVSVLATGFADPNINSGMFSQRSDPNQVICQAGGKTERTTSEKDKLVTWDGPGPAVFAGVSEQYFLVALVPEAGRSTCHLEADTRGWLKASIETPVKVAAGGSWSQTLSAFAGPKDTEELGKVGAALKDSVDFGFWAVIASFLLAVMKFFYAAFPIHNWGIAIILLTLAVKAVTFPLQWKSMKSMQEMQRIQPEIEALKKRLGGDTQRFNEEQMKLFKEHGVNPMGGCLPMVIQMPVWFALYTTLRVSVELYNSMFIPGWLVDLTSIDPYYILPVAMGATMLLTQILTPQPMSNPSQKTIGYVMTAVFSVMMVNLPSGLTLYIFTNNILSIAMQMYLKRALKISPAAKTESKF